MAGEEKNKGFTETDERKIVQSRYEVGRDRVTLFVELDREMEHSREFYTGESEDSLPEPRGFFTSAVYDALDGAGWPKKSSLYDFTFSFSRSDKRHWKIEIVKTLLQ